MNKKFEKHNARKLFELPQSSGNRWFEYKTSDSTDEGLLIDMEQDDYEQLTDVENESEEYLNEH